MARHYLRIQALALWLATKISYNFTYSHAVDKALFLLFRQMITPIMTIATNTMPPIAPPIVGALIMSTMFTKEDAGVVGEDVDPAGVVANSAVVEGPSVGDVSDDIGVVGNAEVVVEDCVIDPVADVGAVDDPLVAFTGDADAVVAVVAVTVVVAVCDDGVSVVEA